MKPRLDLRGLVFGKLTVLEFSGFKRDGKYRYQWLCKCDCGRQAHVDTQHLRAGAIKNCGCVKRSRQGFSQHPLFNVWVNMMNRCYGPENKSYPRYGGRGILVSEEWQDPVAFIKDMHPRPEGLTLERVNNEESYSKANCVWADAETQANNRRSVRLYPFEGRKLSVAQWAREIGMPAETLRSRLKVGRPICDALKPVNFKFSRIHKGKKSVQAVN